MSQASPQKGGEREIGGYVIKQAVGFGAQAEVRLARPLDSSQNVLAVKIIPKKNLRLEQRIHGELTHPNIIKVKQTVTQEDFVFIFMEYAAGGEIFEKIKPEKGVSESVAHLFFTQLISAVEYIHQKGICHRDLKPENLLLDVEGNLKLTDFGLATVFMEQKKKRLLHSFCGSPPYIAPELSRGRYDGEAADIWSCGVVLFMLLAGGTPWEEPSPQSEEFRNFAEGKIDVFPWLGFPESVKSLILGMLTIDPAKRMTIPQIKNHPWFQMRNDLVSPSGLCADPQRLAELLDLEIKPISLDDDEEDLKSLSQPLGPCRTLSLEESAELIHSSQPLPTRFSPFQTVRFLSSEPLSVTFDRLCVSFKFLGLLFAGMDSDRIAFETEDRRKCLLKGFVLLRAFGSKTIVLFRRKKGDPLEFQSIFLAVKKNLRHIICPQIGER